MRTTWIVALVAFAALMLFAGAQDVLAAERTMKIKVPGCVWGDTATTVRITVQRMEGVKSVESNAVAGTATIVYDDSRVDYEKIRKELQRAGFPPVGKPEYLN